VDSIFSAFGRLLVFVKKGEEQQRRIYLAYVAL
jgi:hypothetical protein